MGVADPLAVGDGSEVTEAAALADVDTELVGEPELDPLPRPLADALSVVAAEGDAVGVSTADKVGEEDARGLPEAVADCDSVAPGVAVVDAVAETVRAPDALGVPEADGWPEVV